MSSTVLVLESNQWLGDQYQQALESQGFTVARTDDPHVAMDMIDDNPPSAIIMNLLLNGAGGVGLLHELQSYVDTATIPVIVCTAQSSLSMEDLESYGVKKLMNNTTMKPDDLAAAVRSVLA